MANNKIKRLEILDKLLASGKPVSFQDCVDKMDPIFKRLDDKLYSSSMDSAYGDNFRQDIRTIREIISTPANNIDPEMLITEGQTRYTTYRYKDPNFSIMPYLEYRYTKADYKNLETALKKLSNTLPADVFENIEFALRSRIEYDYGHKEKDIDYGENYKLKGRERLPFIYKCINKTVLSITYKTFDDETETYELHPYLLKLYNNRWFLFGYRPDEHNYYWCVPIDRIEKLIKTEVQINPRPDNYNNHFDDIIGVTKGSVMLDDSIDNNAIAEKIKIGITDIKTWKRVITKPIHKSQKTITDFSNGYGELELNVIPNNEFYNSLLILGAGVIIVEPASVKNIIRNIIRERFVF